MGWCPYYNMNIDNWLTGFHLRFEQFIEKARRLINFFFWILRNNVCLTLCTTSENRVNSKCWPRSILRIVWYINLIINFWITNFIWKGLCLLPLVSKSTVFQPISIFLPNYNQTFDTRYHYIFNATPSDNFLSIIVWC